MIDPTRAKKVTTPAHKCSVPKKYTTIPKRENNSLYRSRVLSHNAPNLDSMLPSLANRPSIMSNSPAKSSNAPPHPMSEVPWSGKVLSDAMMKNPEAIILPINPNVVTRLGVNPSLIITLMMGVIMTYMYFCR